MRSVLLLAMTALLAALESWNGALPVGSVTFTDITVQGIELRIHHPTTGSGPWPVVVFSHGLAGSKSGYAFLGGHWAAHGYVSIHPTHAGSDTAILRDGPPGEIMQRLRRATMDPEVLRGRPRCIAAIIDALPEIEGQVPQLAGKLDRAHIGVGGHSFGAWTTMMVAGQKAALLGNLADARPIAFLPMSPSGRSATSKDEDWAPIVRPMLVMTGSDDQQPAFLCPPGETRSGAWRRQAFDLLPAGDKVLLWLEGARHCTFSAGAGNVLTGDPAPDPVHLKAVQAVSLAWWDARLRGDARAAAWLADPAAGPSLGTGIRIERR